MWYGASYLVRSEQLKIMSYFLEIKLKEEKNPSIWDRFMKWLDGDDDQPLQLGQQLPKRGTNTDILLSQTQKTRLTQAVESPMERNSDTTSFVKRSDSSQDSSLII